MISEFLWIEKVEENENEIKLICELPDIEGDNDEFVQCGIICIKTIEDETKGFIHLYENFNGLCEGEIFDKNSFIRDVAFSIENKFGIDVSIQNYEFV